MIARLTRTLAWSGVLLGAFSGSAFAAKKLPKFVQNGNAGFVVTNIQYALAKDAAETGVCPEGLTPPHPAPESRTPGQRDNPTGPTPCANPEAFGPDPSFRTVKSRDVKGFGIDIDGRRTSAKSKVPGTCSHDDLIGMNGERGIDNQFYRAVGCLRGYQSTGQGNTFEKEMHTGSWGILITLSGVDDLRTDDTVEVTFFANADPIELSSQREPLPYATYAIDRDPRFQAKTRGRIQDGILTTEPVDVRFRKVTNAMYLERPLIGAVAKMTLSDEGVLQGYLAGYTPVEAMYDFEFAFRNAKTGGGEPADPRRIANSSRGRAANMHYTCNGIYHALRDLADGTPDPETGRCTSVSTQYEIKAIPAFVVNAATKSSNEDLNR